MDEIARYYAEGSEEHRLTVGAFQLEAARTRELLQRFLPRPPARVLDVGGATGPYAFWLAEKGYHVDLVDLSPRLVEAARARNASAAVPLASAEVGDARALETADSSVDAVLCLGPLYHLTDEADRQRALGEARRVLVPKGVLAAAAISRYASSLDGLSRDLLADHVFRDIVRRDLAEGQHRNPTDRFDYFTTAFFHRPEDLAREVTAAGFREAVVYGIEGPGWILRDFDARWADARKRQDLVDVARALEREPSVIGASAHLLAIGRKDR